MLVSRSGLGALNVFAFGDVRHVAGGGVKKPPHPFALAFWGWLERQGVSEKIYKDDKAVFTNLFGRPPPDLWLGEWDYFILFLIYYKYKRLQLIK